MQKKRKQLLGLAGLALVGVITAVACAIPAPNASAMENSVDVKVQVMNPGTKPEVEIVKFTVGNTDSVFSRVFKATVRYLRADDLKVYLKNNGKIEDGASLYANPDAEAGELALDTSVCNITFSEDKWQDCEVTYELAKADGEFGLAGTAFSTRAVATNGNNGSSSEDAVSFYLRDALLQDQNSAVQNGDPIMKATLSNDVKSAYIAVYDKDGNEVTIPSNDGSGRYKLHLDQIVEENGVRTLKFAVPLWEAQAEAGDYTVVLLAYSSEEPTENTLIGMATADTYYGKTNPNAPGPNDPLDPNIPGGPNNPNTPDVPVTPNRPGGSTPSDPNDPNNPNNPDDPNTPDTPPNTGLNIFKELNISRADYIVTGLVAFGIVTGFAIFLIVRRNKR